MKEKNEEMERAVRDFQAGLDPGNKNSELIVRFFTPWLRNLFNEKNISPPVRQELIQETFLRVFNKIGTVRDAGAIHSWVLRTARNVLYDHVRGEKSRPSIVSWDAEGRLSDFDRPDTAPGGNPFRMALAREGERLLDEARKVLAPRQYDCWVLRHEQGLSDAQIGEIMGIAVPTVRSTIRDAENKMLKFINSRLRKSDADDK
jgi:RNA polymerase sigma-70 factor, ECF subfamily